MAMTRMMSKRERLEATIDGAPVDRPAVALWRHWPVDDQSGPALARATVTFQRDYDFDFVKVTPSSNFPVAGYGAASIWEGNLEGTRVWGPRVIQTAEDWLRLAPLAPTDGLLGEVVAANRQIVAGLGAQVPVIQTIFNPLAQAKNLAGDRLLSDLRREPEAVKAGLDVLLETTLRFMEALGAVEMAGVFLAIQHASTDLLTPAEYRSFGLPYDREILAAAADMGWWLNVVHLHGHNVMFDLVEQYQAQVVNWHDQETPPTLLAARRLTDRVVCGGLRQWDTMMRGTPDKVRSEAAAAIEATGGRRFILGTGCVTPIAAPTGNLRAARESVGPWSD